MNNGHSSATQLPAYLDNLAAELTEAAYPVVLQHGAGENWLDLKLALWKAMSETVKKLDLENLQIVSSPSELREASRILS